MAGQTIMSMTGYGKAVAEEDGRKATVEIKTLNSRQMDLFTRLPTICRDKEMEIRSAVAQRLERGKTEITITLENIGAETPASLNIPLICSYKTQIEALAQAMNVDPPSDWLALILRMPDAIRPEVGEIGEAEWNIVSRALNEAIDRTIEFRAQEGAALDCVLRQKIANISDLLKQIEIYETERIDRIRERIADNLQRLAEITVDANRFEQEMIYYIEKLDVNEEKTRLANHLRYFLETMTADAQPGKKLGFIAQEIGREVNTLGSKSNHTEMQQIVVRMKDELEQIKEQVLNIL